MDVVWERVAGALARQGVDAASAAVVGCSGGPDSTALAHAAMALAADGRLGEVTLVYVDHALRADSAADGERVRALAEAGGGRYRCVPVTVERDGASLEAAARRARHRALESVAAELGAPVLLAHTSSDQAETVLMRILRGTGVVGVSAMAERRGRIIRPLLGLSRAEVEAYLARHHLGAVDDPMNRDRQFFRARVRHEWLPALARENPRIERALVALAASAAEARELIDRAAESLLAAAGGLREPGSWSLPVSALAEAPAAAAKRALAMAAERAAGAALAARHIEDVWALVRAPERGTRAIDLPELVAVREYGLLRLQAPGESHTAPAPAAEVRGAGAPVVVRRWRHGDRMRPARLRGRSRKLSDLFIDLKIPRPLRARAVVVARESDGAIEWAQYVGPAHGSRIEVTLTTPGPPATNVV